MTDRIETDRRRERTGPWPLRVLLLALVGIMAIAIGGNILYQRSLTPADAGLVFVIPDGASASLDVPTVDSAIAIPTDIRFDADDVAVITVRNDDRVANRAGPWVVGPGQSYTARFDRPGTYQFDCTVNDEESVTVTVTS